MLYFMDSKVWVERKRSRQIFLFSDLKQNQKTANTYVNSLGLESSRIDLLFKAYLLEKRTLDCLLDIFSECC